MKKWLNYYAMPMCLGGTLAIIGMPISTWQCWVVMIPTLALYTWAKSE